MSERNAHRDRDRPAFEVSQAEAPSDVLLAGFSNVGLAGLTAVDFLVEQFELRQTGHVTADQLPAITPFENGTPRHHTRLFSNGNLDVTALLGELFVPAFAADPFADAITDWVREHDVSEIVVLTGVPIPHGPEDHRVFYIATEDYRESRLEGSDIPPMESGFLDGVNASLVGRGIDSPLAVSVFVTPVHAQAPDVEAAIRLLEAVAPLYDLDLDTGPLEAFANEIRDYYADLQQRLESVAEEQRPQDRMYM